jgi:hypothetical protein
VVEQAAERVRAAQPSERVRVAAAEAKAASDRPEFLEVLKAVVRLAPEAAPGCVKAAVTARRELAGEIAFAVVQAAPDYAPLVVKEACQVAPEQFSAVATAAGRAAPLRSHSIVLALSDTGSELRDPLERAKTLVGKGRTWHPSVPVLLQQTVELIEADLAAKASEEEESEP